MSHCSGTNKKSFSNTNLVVITGGPGAGKTAVLEVAKKFLCARVAILPEAASIIFSGGFWRLESDNARAAAQTAIYHVQKQMEQLVHAEHRWGLGLCDRGTLDGLAYWPKDEATFWDMTQSQILKEYVKYKTVIHLKTPPIEHGYNHQNPLRLESASQAKKIDEKIAKIWSNHPHYRVIESSASFWLKTQTAIEYIIEELPECCKKDSKEEPK